MAEFFKKDRNVAEAVSGAKDCDLGKVFYLHIKSNSQKTQNINCAKREG